MQVAVAINHDADRVVRIFHIALVLGLLAFSLLRSDLSLGQYNKPIRIVIGDVLVVLMRYN